MSFNKYQEALELVKESYAEGEFQYNYDEVNTLKELVDKTVPMAPIKELIMLGPGGKFTSRIKCPKCRTRIVTPQKVCPECAQALDWSNYD